MSLASGTRLGIYEVAAKLGEGGMGEVYRARDTKLGRDVALKILPERVGNDPDRLARFEREAHLLASLNHPNIAAIYGVEDSSSVRALVLELVDGPTLADRIAAGAMPVQEALAIARQIADALAAAHESGVIHRDLKPANIKVRDDGAVKVLDFGLAKALDAGATDAAASPSNSPTLTARATAMGMIIGTAAYMAPEQARGRNVDRRADLWAFGVVLYEMLTGRRAFDGAEVTDVLASVIRDTPSLDALPSDVPAGVRRLLRRTLEKDRARRLDSMAAARLDLDDVEPATTSSVFCGPGPSRGGLRSAVMLLAAGLVSALAAGALVWRVMQPAPPAVTRVSITSTAETAIAVETNHHDVAVTPDGTRLVYFSRIGVQNRMVVRPFDSFEPTVLSNLGEDARSINISPDGEWIAYQAGLPTGTNAALYKAPLAGGTPQQLTGITGNLRGVTWMSNGTLIFATVFRGTGLMQVSAAGGTSETLTTPSVRDGEADHLWPHTLPDGRHVLFSISRSGGTFDVALLSLDTRAWRILLKNGQFPRYANTGHILFAQSGTLRAISFDPSTLEVRGESVEIAPGIVMKESGAADFALSDTGTLAYLPGSARSTADRLQWREPDGRDSPTAFPEADYGETRISPDGQFGAAVIGATATGAASLWLLDLSREVSSRLTPSTMRVSFPTWSRDSRHLAFWADSLASGEPAGIFVIPIGGTEAPARITTAQPGFQHRPGSWLPDNRAILYTNFAPGVAGTDIMQVALDPPHTVTPILSGPTMDVGPALSPDGRWLAHVTLDPDTRLFVRPFPNVHDARIPVSSEPAQAGIWSLDGKSLYYVDPALRTRYVVSITASGGSLTIGKPRAFLELRGTPTALVNASMPPLNGRVLHKSSTSPASSFNEYRVVFNWPQELLARTKK